MEGWALGVLTQPLYEMPTRHELEDKAAILLREYYTIDDDIEVQREMANGNNLPEPRVTPALHIDEPAHVQNELRVLHEFSVGVSRERIPSPLSDGETEIAKIVSRYVKTNGSGYATIERVHRTVSRLAGSTREEQEVLKLFSVMLHEAKGEFDDTRLNDIEILVERRWNLIERARLELNRLEKNKYHVGRALRMVEGKYPESYELLWLKYVQDYTVHKVSDVMRLMTDRVYQTARDNAMERFLYRCPMMEELETRKSDVKHKRGTVRNERVS